MAEQIVSYGRTAPHYAEDLVIHRPGVMRPISWGALFGGVMISLAFQLLMSILAIGLGLNFLGGHNGTGGSDPNAIGLGAGLWWGIVYLVSLLFGGYFAARMSGMVGVGDGIMHGILTWAFGLLVIFYLLTTAVGGALGGVLNVVGKSVSAAGNALQPMVAQVANTSGISPGNLDAQAQQLLKPSNGTKLSPEQARAQLTADLKTFLAGGSNAAQARTDIMNLMSSQLGITPQQATQRLDQWQAEFNRTKNQVVIGAKNAALSAAHTASWFAIWSFVALALGIVTGAIGGALGTRGQVAEASR